VNSKNVICGFTGEEKHLGHCSVLSKNMISASEMCDSWYSIGFVM